MKALRTLCVSLLVLGCLGFFTSKLYYSPRRLEARIALALRRHAGVTPAVTGARQGWIGPLTVRDVEVPAAPVLDQRSLLVLHGIEVEPVGEDWSGLRLIRRPPAGALDLDARDGELAIERELAPAGGGALGTRAVWNFQDLFPERSLLAETARAGHRLEVEGLLVKVRFVDRRRELAAWTFTVEDFRAEGTPEGAIELRGDLPASPFWEDGRFEVVVRPAPGAGEPALTARGSLDGVEGIDPWLGALFPEYPRVKALLAPEGPVELTLESLRVSRGGESGEARAVLDYRASVRHYDSRLRIAPWGIEVRHASGTVALDPRGHHLGPAGDGEGGGARRGLAGEVWGAPVELAGSIGERGAEIALRLGDTEIRSAEAAALPPPIAAILRAARPAGTVAGELRLRVEEDGRFEWSARAGFRDLRLDGLPFAGPLTGKLDLSSAAGGGSGRLEIGSGRIEPFGALSGRMEMGWKAAELALEAAEVSLGGGILAGKVVRSAGGALSGTLRWEGSAFDFAEGLLTAASVRGKLDLASTDGEPRAEARMDLEKPRLAAVRIPAAGFPLGDGESAAFADGELAATLAGDGIRRVELALRGERAALRLRGKVSYGGDVDAVAVLAVGEAARPLNLLPPGAPPAEWRRAVQDRALPLRLRGAVDRCRLRKIDWSDPQLRP